MSFLADNASKQLSIGLVFFFVATRESHPGTHSTTEASVAQSQIRAYTKEVYFRQINMDGTTPYAYVNCIPKIFARDIISILYRGFPPEHNVPRK
jgi:hypothetical protein